MRKNLVFINFGILQWILVQILILKTMVKSDFKNIDFEASYEKMKFSRSRTSSEQTQTTAERFALRAIAFNSERFKVCCKAKHEILNIN